MSGDIRLGLPLLNTRDGPFFFDTSWGHHGGGEMEVEGREIATKRSGDSGDTSAQGEAGGG
jgi:hypothetical protein